MWRCLIGYDGGHSRVPSPGAPHRRRRGLDRQRGLAAAGETGRRTLGVVTSLRQCGGRLLQVVGGLLVRHSGDTVGRPARRGRGQGRSRRTSPDQRRRRSPVCHEPRRSFDFTAV